MQKTIRLMAILFASVIISSCGGSGGDPKQVVKAFGEKMSTGDFDGASKYVTTESQMALNMMKTMLKRMESSGKVNKEEMVSKMTEKYKGVEFGETKITGDEAIVPVKSKDDGNSSEIHLRKEMGAWKIDFSPDRVMDEKNQDNKETVPQQKLSAEDIQKLMKMGDSALRNMTPEDRERYKKMSEFVQDEMKKNKEANK